MEAAQTVNTGETFEQFMASMREFRASLQDLRKSHEEFNADMDRIKKRHEEFNADMDKIKEGHKEFNADMDRIKKLQAETSEQMKITDKQIGKLGNRFGDMVEYMIMPNLLIKFEELKFTFTKANRTEIKDREHNIFAEVDAFLENGEKVMIVEIKSKPDIDDINDHIKRMKKLREYADLHNDKRAYLGAVAGVVFGEAEKIYALKKGFYVIEPSGDTFSIIEPKGRYHPREW